MENNRFKYYLIKTENINFCKKNIFTNKLFCKLL